ncbi:plasmid rolling circle replication initiator protein Rep, partial [Staphylococcus cohnii]
MRLICVVKICLSTISLTNNSNELTAIKETSKYSVKSSDFLTDDDEKNQEIVND